MSEAILKALMQLFALIVDIDELQEISDKERAIIRSFLSRQLNNELVEKYMKEFDEYLHLYHESAIEQGSIRKKKRTTLTAVRILSICEKINEELEQTQKIYVVIQLIEYIAYGIEIREQELEFLQTVASAFNINDEEYENILNFVAFSVKDIPGKNKVLIINDEETPGTRGVQHIQKKNLQGVIYILNISSVNTYVLRYHGTEDLFLNGQVIHSGLTYTFDHGSAVRGPQINPIYYTDVASVFSSYATDSKIKFVAKEVEFRFKNSENGIQNFNFSEDSGKLVGIMGGSGVGKSTLLNVLNGNLRPQQGKILINGYDLYDEKEHEILTGVIGFIPQDDLLIEDLTVFQNLYFNAKLCLDDLTEEEIRATVRQVLIDLDLFEIKDLKVGKPLSKVISGGQRKRVNIGLELIRQPSVLFVDEPTSGLSSVDSEMVMNLLKEQAYKGRLVIVNIHQPSSNLYKMFDRIIFMDRGGYEIYYGNPSEAVIYFKTKSNHANANEDQCIRCGNVDADQVLQIIEAKIVNEHGKLSRTRKVSPKEWFTMYRESSGFRPVQPIEKSELPENQYSTPGLLDQMRIFFTRDIISKLTNLQYILLSMLEAPLLAAILAFFTKYFKGTIQNPAAYIFRENENLPAYLLMSVIVFLFLGLNMSSEEIIKDRKILQRESFLHLSRFSYLNSKVLIMIIISAIQTLTYVLVGNLIFEIRGMLFPYWLVLFTTSCFATMLGLNISSGLNSVITIYILVPFLLIPQILLSGVIVKFDKLHKALTNDQYVPVIGDIMTSRWAFEALAVEQFKNNRYQRIYFYYDQQISTTNYRKEFLIGELQNHLDNAWLTYTVSDEQEQLEEILPVIREEVARLQILYPDVQMGSSTIPETDRFDETDYDRLKRYFNELSGFLTNVLRGWQIQKNQIEQELIDQMGGKIAYGEFINRFENKQLADMMLNRDGVDKIILKDGRAIRKYQPIYMVPTSRAGRAQLYAPVKRLGNLQIDTLWFNIVFIWFTTLLLYITLYFDLLRKILGFAESFKLRKQS
ncbi:MAG: ATP-binding cassette domain-containing protein [Bacteroidales bacterium]